MKKLKFFPEVGATAACTLRLMCGAEYGGLLNDERQRANTLLHYEALEDG